MPGGGGGHGARFCRKPPYKVALAPHTTTCTKFVTLQNLVQLILSIFYLLMHCTSTLYNINMIYDPSPVPCTKVMAPLLICRAQLNQPKNTMLAEL